MTRAHARGGLQSFVPLVDRHAFGSLSYDCGNPSPCSVEGATAGSFDCSWDLRNIGLLGCGIERFDLADSVGFRLGLSVEALNSRTTESGACEALTRSAPWVTVAVG